MSKAERREAMAENGIRLVWTAERNTTVQNLLAAMSATHAAKPEPTPTEA